jgi:DNA-binding response OmpR family regulator
MMDYTQKRALIVDEDTRTSSLIESVLVSVGLEPLKLSTPAEATEAFQQGRFVVAFLGSTAALPGGATLTRMLRDSTYNASTPVILLSNDPRPKAMAEGFEAGATFFLYKPIDRDRLLRLVRATHGAMENKLMRRTRRVSLTSKVEVWFSGERMEGETINASLEGVLIKAAKAVPVGSSISMKLHLAKDMPPLAANGAVVRLSDKGEIGIQFGRLKVPETQRLEDFLLPLIPAAQ